MSLTTTNADVRRFINTCIDLFSTSRTEALRKKGKYLSRISEHGSADLGETRGMGRPCEDICRTMINDTGFITLAFGGALITTLDSERALHAFIREVLMHTYAWRRERKA